MVKQSKFLIITITFMLLLGMIAGCTGKSPTPTPTPATAPTPVPVPTPVPELGPVEYLATSLIITPPIVVTGSVATVEAEIRNLDATEGIAEVTMSIDDGETKTKEITLEGSGTQTVSFDVTKANGGKYDIEISGVTKTLTVVNLKKYSDSNFKYSVSHPGGWTINRKKYNNVVIRAPLSFPMLITIVGVNDGGVKTLDEAQQDFIDSSENNPDLVILSSEKVRYDGGFDGYESLVTGNINGAKVKGKVQLIVSGQLTFVSTFLANKEEMWNNWQSVADTMLKSFNPPSPDFVPPPKPAPAPVPKPAVPSTITSAWVSDSGQGPKITEFPAGIEKIYVYYRYQSQVGAIHKIIWYDNSGKVSTSGVHTGTSASGAGSWSRPYPQTTIWPAGSYKAELLINDKLLTTVTWEVLE